MNRDILSARILVVDDQETNLRVIGDMMGHLGFDIVPALDGREDLVAADDPACVRGEQVEQALLQRGEVQLRRASPHGAVEDVDLQLAQRDPQFARDRTRPAGDR